LAYRVTTGGGEGAQIGVDAWTGEILWRTTRASEAFDLDIETAQNQVSAGTSSCYTNTTVDDFVGDENGLLPSFANDTDANAMLQFSKMTYDFYRNTSYLQRDSIDDNGREMPVYIHVALMNNGKPTKNARFDPCSGGILEFSDGWIVEDMMTHEWTHGVVSY